MTNYSAPVIRDGDCYPPLINVVSIWAILFLFLFTFAFERFQASVTFITFLPFLLYLFNAWSGYYRTTYKNIVGQPSEQPTEQPSMQPTEQPSAQPSRIPTSQPSSQPSEQPSSQPSLQPIMHPTGNKCVVPSWVYFTSLDDLRNPIYKPCNTVTYPLTKRWRRLSSILQQSESLSGDLRNPIYKPCNPITPSNYEIDGDGYPLSCNNANPYQAIWETPFTNPVTL